MLDIAVEDVRISPHMCIKCRNRLTTWEDAINDLNAFIKLAQSSLQAEKKRTKVPRHLKVKVINRNVPEIHLAIT